MHQSISISIILISLFSTIPFTKAQSTTASAAAATASPNGLIVPFSSGLPACASKCGPLFDVQGACTPPNIAEINDSCFCSDTRLTPFDDSGTAGVSSVCGPASCTDATSLQDIKTWYDNFCASNKDVTSATTSGTASTSTSTTSGGSSSSTAKAKSAGQSWLQSHWRWVIMLVVLFVVIVGGWVGAFLLRRRYIRKRDKEIEMLPPVALGPHQLQAMSGGYTDGTTDVRGGRNHPLSHSKQTSSTMAMVTPAGGKRVSKGWLRKSRT